nr:hemicentin-1-like isoform X2 [Vanessa tameamea]
MFISCLIYIFLSYGLLYTNGDDAKVSLTFVIDDTGSMYNDIAQVKAKTNEVFDAVLHANASKIDDFILITFNDPYAKLRTITRDRNEFKRALSSISVDGGGDCPEYTMAGIELALEKSKSNSYFYVFTDASAKDYNQFDRIKSLSQKKSIQVSFLLTGICGSLNDRDYLVFEELSEATSGQVFHIKKHDINKIINYIIASITHKKTTLRQKLYENGSGKKLTFTVDSKVWDVIISISAKNPKIKVIDPDGNVAVTKDISTTEMSYMGKLNAKPGVYTIELSSNSKTSVVVTGSTSVSFQHGFAYVKPASINETSTMPVPGVKSYLSIALNNDKKDVVLKTAELRDLDDNVIKELPLTLIDPEKQFYITDPFIPPSTLFKIAVNGFTETNEKITRVSSTTVELQKPELEKSLTKKSPQVTLLSDDKIEVEYGQAVDIKCKLHGFPKPDALWEGTSGITGPATVVPVDLPYDYMTVLTIDKVVENSTITCKAINSEGESSKSVKIEIKTYLNVIEYPKDITLEYGKTIDLKFIINASPPAIISWYKNDKQITVNDNYNLSSDNTILTIRNMLPKLKGKYTVKAVNDNTERNVTFNVSIIGAEPPVIDKSVTTYFAKEGSDVDINCRLLKGKPKPTVSWIVDGLKLALGTDMFGIEEDGTLIIKNVNKYSSGTYLCKAENSLGHVSEEFYVKVYPYPRTRNVPVKELIEEGTSANIECEPSHDVGDLIRWYKNGVLISTGPLTLRRASPSDSGLYSCRVSNYVSSHSSHKMVIVGRKPRFNSEEETRIEFFEGANVFFVCSATGFPNPTITWSHNGRKIEKTSATIDLVMKFSDIGEYECQVSNDFGKISRTFNIVADDCLLNIENNFNTYKPLILSLSKRWPLFEINGSFMRIPKNTKFLLVCPTSYITHKSTNFGQQRLASCVGNTEFQIIGKNIDFEDLNCNEEIKPLSKSTGLHCSRGNTELLKVGYSLRSEFLGVYDICFDKDKNVTLYSRHHIHRSLADRVPDIPIKFTGSNHLPKDFNAIYKCRDKCCFAKKQLVNPRDVSPGFPQVATYNDLNVLPHWSTCGTENWDEVERRVRSLVKFLDFKLSVWTGAFYDKSTDAGIILRSSDQPTPQYMWKVIRNLQEQQALAVIQVNKPNLTKSEAARHMLCKDVCGDTEWMRNPEWRNVTKGFTYCCSLTDFKKAFGYENIFKGKAKLLRKMPLVSEHSLT